MYISQIRISNSRNYSLSLSTRWHTPTRSRSRCWSPHWRRHKGKRKIKTAAAAQLFLFFSLPYRRRLFLSFIPIRFFFLLPFPPQPPPFSLAAIDSLEQEMTRSFFFFLSSVRRVGSRRLKGSIPLRVSHTHTIPYMARAPVCVCVRVLTLSDPRSPRFLASDQTLI